MITPNKMQQEVLDKPSDKPICLIINGAGAGNTTALVLAALSVEQRYCAILSTYGYDRPGGIVATVRKLLPEDEYRYSRKSCIFTSRLTGKKIAIKPANNLNALRELSKTDTTLFIDGFHHLSIEYTMNVVTFKNIYATASPACTQYFLNYDDGVYSVDLDKSCRVLPFFDIKNSLDEAKKFMCGHLRPEMIRDNVHLVTGYTICDELDRICPMYKHELLALDKNIPRYDSLVYGTWKE